MNLETVLQFFPLITGLITGVGVVYLVILTYRSSKQKINITFPSLPVCAFTPEPKIALKNEPKSKPKIEEKNKEDLVPELESPPKILLPPIINISGSLTAAHLNILSKEKDRFKTTFFSPENNPFTFYIIEDTISGYGYLIAQDENGNKVAPTKIYICNGEYHEE